MKLNDIKSAVNLTVLVAGLGYFVDMFDLTLFGVVRRSSLASFGLNEEQILSEGLKIYNAQMIGLMIGGLFWGYWADRKGRLSVLFGSILIYSLGNLANAFVPNIELYTLCRFITGFGLAGELGAAITLVAEKLPVSLRGIGTTIVATLGLLGSVFASYVGQHVTWQQAYILGGILGLLLLVTRFQILESKMYLKHKPSTDFFKHWGILFKPGTRLKYLRCFFIGVPIYFITGILFTFSPELTANFNLTNGPVVAGQALLWGSLGLAGGDLLSGLFSQILKSRRIAIAISLVGALILTGVYLNSTNTTTGWIYSLCFGLGLMAGYWAVLVTMAAEQFGTNIRGTVTTTIPNFVRGSAVISTLSFSALKSTMDVRGAALSVGLVAFGVALVSIWFTRESFSQDLDFEEI